MKPFDPEVLRDRRVLGILALCAGVACVALTLTQASPAVRTGLADSSSAHYNGIVDSKNGSALTLRTYPADAGNENAADLNSDLPAAGQLPSGTEVHIACYLTAANPVNGPQGQGAGGSDPYWDEIDAADTAMPSVPTGQVAVAPDAFIQTNNAINQTVPACSGPALTVSNGQHDPSMDQNTTGAKHSVLFAQPVAGPSLPSSDLPQGGCAVGSVPLDALTCAGPVKDINAVVTYASYANVDPRLLLAILYNESGCHLPQLPHSGACDAIRIHLNGALGIANMHPDAFTAAQTQAGGALADYQWSDLADNNDLDVEAEAWYVAYLDQTLPDQWPSPHGQNELLAMMYNAGSDNITPIIQGAQAPGPYAQGYLDQIRSNWDFVDQLICRSGAYICSL